MADIGSNTRSTSDIIESKFGDEGFGFEEEGQRLANATFFASMRSADRSESFQIG